MSIAEKLVTIAENEPKVYEAGKKAEHDRFWDSWQLNGTRNNYTHAFGIGWREDTWYPKYNLDCSRGAYCMFAYFSSDVPFNLKQRLSDCGLTMTFQNCPNCSNVFQTSGITELGELDFSTVTRKNCTAIFQYCGYLKSVDKLILPVGQTTFSNWFTSCIELESIIFEGTIDANNFDIHWSTKLDHDSLMSIINCLGNRVGQSTYTVTLGAENLAKLTDAEKAIATEKGWTLA